MCFASLERVFLSKFEALPYTFKCKERTHDPLFHYQDHISPSSHAKTTYPSFRNLAGTFPFSKVTCSGLSANLPPPLNVAVADGSIQVEDPSQTTTKCLAAVGTREGSHSLLRIPNMQ